MKKTMIYLTIITACFFLFSYACNNNNNDNFLYKVRVEINSGDVEYKDKVVELNINLEAKLKDCYSTGKKVDYCSIRIVEVDSQENVVSTCTSQYDINTLLWVMKGTTPKRSTRYYNIYFNTTDREKIVSKDKPEPMVIKEDLQSKWAFTTPNGYFVFEKSGGAFEVFSPVKCEDNAPGKDWLRDDCKEYNGILNIGDPDTKAIFHPNEDTEVNQGEWKGCKSDIMFEGPLRYRLRSINKFGKLANDYRSSTAYSVSFDIFPNFIRASVTKGNNHGYACVMELTPGGDSLESTDYVVRSNGTKYLKDETYAEDIENEWALIGDQQDSIGLFFIHAQDDSIIDGLNWYEFMQTVMVGWGRGANPGINNYPNEFYFGFSHTTDNTNMKKLVASLTSTPEISIGKTQKRELEDWGAINIKKINNNLQISIENNKILCTYSPVLTANLETAITKLIIKENNINISGSLIDEMARGGGDRGTLSDKTGIIYEGKDKKTVHLEWDNGASIQEITIFKDKPYLKIDYVDMYINICDLGNNEVFEDGEYAIFGADSWRELREKQLSSGFKVDSNAHHALTNDLFPQYPNPLLGEWNIEEKDNPMNYKGWYILGVHSPKNGVGYGRVIPANVIDHLKLLNNSGFEQFPFWFGKQTKRPFSEYLFAIKGGKDEIISMGKEIVEIANKEDWYLIDSTHKIMGNNLIEIGYGSDKIVEGNRLSGLTIFNHKPSNTNLAEVMDAYGYDYARYYIGGPAKYKISHKDDDYIETTVSMFSERVNEMRIEKKERIFRDLPILEIEYSKLDLLWWEDFYSESKEENRAYTIYGIKEEITPEMHATFREKAENSCGHNFGDCYLKAAGSNIEKSIYKGCIIFGFYDMNNQVGLGFVFPASIGVHNGFKLWSMHNYESFPFYHMQQKLPLKRWIFATSKGKEGILSLGKSIADIYAEKENLSSNINKLKDL